MKTFKTYLSEAFNYDGIDVNELIFNEYQYPLSTPMLERIFKKLPRIKAYHLTTSYNIDEIFKLEGTKKAISVLTNAKSYVVQGGIETSGGLVLHVSGKLLAKGEYDIYSVVDSQGRRWLDMANLLSGSTIVELIKKIRAETYLRFTGVELQGELSWVKLQHIKNKKEKGKLIKLFFDVTEELSKKHYKIIESYVMGIHREYSGVTKYNELVINQIKILEAFFIQDSSRFDEDDVDYFENKHSNIKVTVLSSTEMAKIINKK